MCAWQFDLGKMGNRKGLERQAASCWKSRKAGERALRYLPGKVRHGKMAGWGRVKLWIAPG